MEPSEIGRFGTLRLMKRLEPDVSVASFPIDDETVTFGRDPSCSVRLYYASVSPLHAKVIFQDRKAFIVVLGPSGVLVDGCVVRPSQNLALPTTIPISNNSEIEIHKKRFIFNYPPKEMRAALYTSPQKEVPMTPGTRRKMLRMSMIQSAEVFTPRPSKDPGENLRILQSPLKRNVPSPLKQQYGTSLTAQGGQEMEVEEEVVLVDGNHPHVVEEENDLVILESVEVEVPPQPSPPTPIRLGAFGRSANPQANSANPYQTPRRKPGWPSLHRAALIKSAQRAVLKQEIEREEEEQEEKEVEDFIAEEAEDFAEESEEYEQDQEPMYGDEDQGDGRVLRTEDESGGWKKSLGLVEGLGWPFRSSSTTPEEKDEGEKARLEADYDEVPMDVDQELPPSSDSVSECALDSDSTLPVEHCEAVSPALRPWGNFLTPQAGRVGPSAGVGRGAGRNSFSSAAAPSPGFSGPRRVRVEPKWKVTDIVVPLPQEVEIKQEDQGSSIPIAIRKSQITEEERQAIRERRRSALTTPDPYFAGQVPGLGVRRPCNTPRMSPAPLPSLLATATKSLSPAKTRPLSLTKAVTHTGEQSGSEEEEDTRHLLDRMKQTVEIMKRRRSASSLWDGDDEVKPDEDMLHDEQPPAMDIQEENMDEDESDKENDRAGRDVETQRVLQVAGVDEAGRVEEAANEEKDEDAPMDLPLPALTRQSVNPQTPQLESLKHLFSQPKANAVTATPAIQSMRHLFKNVSGDTETPRMDGMRGMSLREERSSQVTATSTFEGIGEMMQTPPVYHASIPDPDVKEDPPAPRKTPAVASTGTHRKTPKTNIGTSKPPSAEPPAAPEALPEGDPATGTFVVPAALRTEAPAPRKARLLRGRKLTPANDESEPSQTKAPSRPTTKGRIDGARKTKADSEPETLPKRPPSRARATPIPEVIVEARVARSEPAKARPRAATKSSGDNTASVPVKITRAIRKGVPASGPRGASGRTTPSEPVQTVDEDDHDPLDSIDQREDAPALKRPARVTAVPRVKQEAEATATANTGSAGRKRAPTPSTSKPAASAPTTRGKAAATTRKKAPSTMTTKSLPESGSESPMDKENTPSREDDDTSGPDTAGNVSKATRAKRVTKTKEVERDDAAKPRTTRATRSRT